MIRVLTVLLLCSTLLSCTEEEDCTGCNLNPRIRVKFEPVKLKAEADSIFTVVKNEISDLVDSLESDLTEEEIAVIQERLEALREDSTSLNEEVALFRAGRIRISELSAPGSKGFADFQDSVVLNFALPVNMNADFTTFYLSYHQLIDTLQLEYQRQIIQDLEGVRMQLRDIGINFEVTTFDSVRLQCNRGICNNEQTTIHIYL
jgi:hypothetical protein